MCAILPLTARANQPCLNNLAQLVYSATWRLRSWLKLEVGKRKLGRNAFVDAEVGRMEVVSRIFRTFIWAGDARLYLKP
jgi:hypothetical protein